MLASLSFGSYLPHLHSEINFPPNLWLLGYLLFSIVSPWATFGHLLSYARCSPRVAQALATYSSSLGYLLFGSQRSSLMGFPNKNLSKVFKSLMFASFSFGSYLPRLHSETIFATKPLATGLPIVSHCFSMGYLWLPIVIYQMQPNLWLLFVYP